MSISVTCPSCGKHMRAPTALSGKQAKCLGCGAAIKIPIPSASTELAAAQEVSNGPQVRRGGPAQAGIPPRLPTRHVDSATDTDAHNVPQAQAAKLADERLGWHSTRIGLTVAEYGNWLLFAGTVFFSLLFVVIFLSAANKKPMVEAPVLGLLIFISLGAYFSGAGIIAVGICICRATPRAIPDTNLNVTVACIFVDIFLIILLPAFMPSPTESRSTPYGTETNGPRSELPFALVAGAVVIVTAIANVQFALFLRSVSTHFGSKKIANPTQYLILLILLNALHELYLIFAPPSRERIQSALVIFNAIGICLAILLPLTQAFAIKQTKSLVGSRVAELGAD